MGHAGAFLLPGDPDALTKIRGLEDAGVQIVNHPAKFGEVMKGLLTPRLHPPTWRKRIFGSMLGSAQKRGVHMMRRRPSLPNETMRMGARMKEQKRNFFLVKEDVALNMLRERGFNASEYSGKGTTYTVAIGVDRRTCSPAIIIPATSLTEKKSLPFDYLSGFPLSQIPEIATHLQLNASKTSHTSLPKLVTTLLDMFKQHEAIRLEATFVERLGDIKIVGANFILDEAILKRSRKENSGMGSFLQETITEEEKEIEREVEKAGIVYIPLPNSLASRSDTSITSLDRNIATLVNGAGLAMNTIDALSSLGGFSTNFLDTGGKATSDTVKRSLRIILRDSRVKVVFVNVFGGLTRGDMIARGVVEAVEELEGEEGGMRVPVVVRIRGTGEEEGRKIVSFLALSIFQVAVDVGTKC